MKNTKRKKAGDVEPIVKNPSLSVAKRAIALRVRHIKKPLHFFTQEEKTFLARTLGFFPEWYRASWSEVYKKV